MNIQSKLKSYDKMFENIYRKFEVLDNEEKSVKRSYKENDKIYLSIAGFSKAASIEDN